MFGLSTALTCSIVWGVLLLLFIVAEAETMELVAIWFIPGAALALLLAAFDAPIGWQISVFVVVSVISLLLSRPICRRLKEKTVKTNVDAIIGQEVLVTEDVDNRNGTGAAKCNGLIWSARAEKDDSRLSAGDSATVCAVQGVKLILIPKN